ncbi:ABC transporter permease [Clostridium botulinum D/C]|uniref:ABC transporter permease n=2 Tax=Clostridium botulinum TaxID=1491 RepID=UPI001E39E52B|nr:ABC transporter permease [Clostridium botulinum]MCD3351851.1 ABC transporter permease [Clostridium botulinum D/C]MCD3360816.1 ABC transporter permease [Clostridium botulinum D/C]MCD3366555.1 ABC transporter permease [Clostridium botulinum D/C]
MTNLIKSNFKIFFRSLYLSVPLLIFFIILNGYFGVGIRNLTIHKDALFYLQYSQRISVIYFIFFTFISYEYLIKSKNSNLLEGISVLNKGTLKLYFSKLIVLVAIILIMTLNIFAYNFIVYIVMKVHSTSYLLHVILNHLLNIFLVSIFAICIGSTISLYFKRFSAYALMILSVILISPISERVPYILHMGYNIDIYFLREPFNILPPNLNWESEYLYGLSIEPYRWNLIAFWISFLAFLMILKLSKRKYKSLNVISIILLIFSLGNFYGYTKPGSILKKDYNPKNFTAFDEIYYSDDVQKEEKALFKISEYDMKLNINRQLENDIIIHLNEKEPLKTYKFTLYRNYKIKKVLGKNNETLEYKRDGDYLEVINPTNNKLNEIRIVYSGSSPVFYSNYQGVLLPGYFPYYPMEGYKRVYGDGARFVPIIRDYTVKFDISLKSNLDIATNLNKHGSKLSGQAQEVTLMGGFLKEKPIKDNIVYESLLDKMDTNVLSHIDNSINSYNKVLSSNYKFTIKSKKIFQAPTTLLYRVACDGIADFKDHIIVPGLDANVLSLDLIQSNLLKNIKKKQISDMLFEYILDKDSFTDKKRFEEMPKEMFENPFYQIDYLFLEKINKLGGDYVIKNTYKFLVDENDKRDAMTFVKDLK